MKVAFLYSYEQSFWKSCQTITKNLKSTYDLFVSSANQKSFNYHDSITAFEMLNAARGIVDFEPDYIVIIDHKPHPQKIIDFIFQTYAEKKIKRLPEIIIHIFGDFTLYSKDWLKIEKTLKNFPVKFICASDSQQALVAKFLKNKKTGLYKCPFPVDTEDFSFNPELRNKYRKTLGLKDNQTLFVYTGRMSLQKQVIELMLDFATYLKVSNSDAFLYFAGEFDDLGNPFKGLYSNEGLFYYRFSKLHASLEDDIQARIRYVGNLTTNELKPLYSAADTFISLSVHNDEDYGMSPAEALATGLPCILTDWAGYRSFKREEDNQCFLIKTSLSEDKITYARDELMDALLTVRQNEAINRKNRFELQKTNVQYLSIASNKSILENIIKTKVSKFSGFSPLLKSLALAFELHPPFAIAQTKHVYTDLYKKIYESYLPK